MIPKPMLLTEEECNETIFSKYSNWIAQEKLNGDRILISVKDGKIVGIRNRRGTPQLYLYPELDGIEVGINEGLLDGELIVEVNGKSVFYDGINKRTHKRGDTATIQQYPVKAVIFDILKHNNQITITLPYSKRLKLLKGIKKGDRIRVVKNWDNPKELWNRVIKENREGVVLKNPLGVYEIDKRSKNNIKMKNYKTAEVIVEEVEPNEKGTKIIGRAFVDGNEIQAESQLAGVFDIEKGDKVNVKYLDIYNNRFIQPHKVR